MKATDFVRGFTVFGAKEYLAGATFYKDKLMIFTDIDDIKQIVDAWELVERFGDLRQAKLNLEHMISHNQFEFCATNIDELQKAINLVEQCQ